jgi:hypothetical protein
MKRRVSIPLLTVAILGFCLAIVGPVAAGADEEEREVTLDQVPAAVKETILEQAEGNELTEIEEVSRDGKVVHYEAEWEVDGKEIEIVVSPDGKLLEREVEDDEDDDEDEDHDEDHDDHEHHDKDHDEHDHHDKDGDD